MRDALPGASFIGFTGTLIKKADCEHAGDLRRLSVDLRHRGCEGGQGGLNIDPPTLNIERKSGEARHQPRRDRPAEPRRPGGDRGRGGCFREGLYQGQVGEAGWREGTRGRDRRGSGGALRIIMTGTAQFISRIPAIISLPSFTSSAANDIIKLQKT